jgi:hypothetical protein
VVNSGYKMTLLALKQSSYFLYSSYLDFGFKSIDGRPFNSYSDSGIYSVENGDIVGLTSDNYPKIFLKLEEIKIYQQINPQHLT